jgi:AcrR family transcriptional regulator
MEPKIVSYAPQTQRFEKKREAILDAAALLFNQKGVRGATLADVAQSVALITNSVTYYYRKKEDLASACFLRTIDVLNNLSDSAAAEAEPRARITKLLLLYADLLVQIARGDRAALMFFSDLRAMSSPHVEVVFAAYTDMFRRMRALLPKCAHDANTRTALNARAHVLVTTIHSMRLWINRYEIEDYPGVAERVANILICGLVSGDRHWAPPSLPRDKSNDSSEVSAESFLRAATFLINEQGYRGASVEKISARLHVTKGSFYHHNDNKDDLVANCFARSFAVIRQTQNAAAALDADGWTKLTATAAELVRYQLSEEGPLLRSTALSALPEIIRHELVATMNRLSLRYANFIVDGIADGSLRPIDQVIAAHLVNGVVDAAAELQRWVPTADSHNSADLFARPLFLGLFAD